MNEARTQFLTALQVILVRYPVAALTGSAADDLKKRKNLQLLFRQEQQYRLGALLTKWSKNDPEISDNEMAKTYFKCVLQHFQTSNYCK